MSAGPALLIESPHQQYFEQLGAGHHYSSNNVEMDNSNNNNSAFSDEDLIASLAGFAVEGQTERDLATIKAMLLSQHHQFPSSGNQFTHNSFNSSAGNGGGIWPMQSPAATSTTSAWSAFNWNPASGQPPPNTPNLSKSLELYGSSANGNNLNNNNEYFSSSARRRDVSLERPHFFNNTSISGRGASSTRHGRSSSITSSNRGDNNSTPGSSLSTGFDMDMGEDEVVQEEQEAEEVIAGPSNFSNTFNGYRPAAAAAVDGGQGYSAGGSNHNGMEDIQEDSMRESLEDAQQHQQQQYQQQSQAAYPAHHHQPSSSANMNFDNRHAGIAGQSPPSSLAPSLTTTKQQWNSNGNNSISSRRSNTSTPTLASSNGHSISRPNSSNSTSSASSPPQTRSRSRQQAQAQAQAANQLRFTSP